MNRALTSLKKIIQVAGVAATSGALLVLGGNPVLAGSVTVVTVGDSSAGGAVNFEASPNSAAGVSVQTLSTAGASVTVSIAPGVTATATSVATAVSTGTLTQAQADTGLASGGAVVTLGAPVVTTIVAAANTGTGETAVSGAGLQGPTSPAAAITTLATSPEVANVTVIMTSGVTVTMGQVLANLSAALGGGDVTILPTALNDASIALLTAVRSNPNNAELRTAGRAVGTLLRAAKVVVNSLTSR